MPQNIAFFDFDGTLAEHDSLWPFLLAVAGPVRCYTVVVAAAALSWWTDRQEPDARSAFKAFLMRHLLKGRRVADLGAAQKRMQSWPRWIAPSVAALRDHHAKGDHVVLITGSLDLYVREMIRDLPIDAILCTQMQVENGVLTGRMDGGNCVRARKAERVKTYLEQHGPFTESWAYGNAPHDLPMMQLTTHGVVV